MQIPAWILTSGNPEAHHGPANENGGGWRYST